MSTPGLGRLDELLATAASAGEVPALTQLLDALPGRSAAEELEVSAAGPFAHILFEAASVEAKRQGELPDHWLQPLLSGLRNQARLLALLDTVDVLLGDGGLTGRYGDRIHQAFLEGHSAAVVVSPLTATAFAEGALRLALAGVVTPMQVLSLLTFPPVHLRPPDYLERLPRLVGAALDRWGRDDVAGPPLRQTLADLREDPVTGADATYEAALDLLRQAGDAGEATASRLLVTARQMFATAEASDEVRHDAALYGAGVDAVLGFLRSDREALNFARESVRHLLQHRDAWLLRANVPQWRQPRRAAERDWSRLIVILDRAYSRSREPVWLDAWDALDAILNAYVLDRTVIPVPGNVGADGFGRVLRPTIERSLVRRRSLLAQVDRATLAAEQEPEQPARLSQLRLLRTRLAALAAEDGDAPDREGDMDAPHLRERLVTTAPSLLATLGEQAAIRIAEQLDDVVLGLVEGVAYNAAVSRTLSTDPIVGGLLERLAEDLLTCRDYVGSTRQAFDLLIRELTHFVAVRHDVARSSGVDYLRPSTPPVREARLQDDFADWLRRGPLAGRVDVEVPSIATGRVDIKVGFGTTRFYVEVKRELRDGSRGALERSYLPQAAEYSGTSAALGLLLVLDLTPHPDGVRHLSECVWVARHRPKDSGVDRYVVVAVVVGNRSAPNTYSR